MCDFENGECEDHPTQTDKQVYQSTIGSLMYAALGTRPDISFAAAARSKYNASPLATHMTAAISLEICEGHSSVQLHYHRDWHPANEHLLEGFTDSDWAGRKPTRESVGGHIFLIEGPPVS